jgi:16S rRNA (guanine527-N7)-methyltransferase
MLPLTNTQINDALGPYGVRTASDLTAGIKTYIELLLKWNKSVSLTTVTKVNEIVRFHFGESLFALPMLPVEKSRLADVGSGAGFPGIPLAMARPSLDVTLIEPNAKKFAFLNEVIRQLTLANVSAVRARTSDLHFSNERFEVITARAVGQFEGLIGWAKTKITPGGRLLLWLGGEDAAQLSGDARFEWSAPLRIPLADRRYILIGSPNDGGAV